MLSRINRLYQRVIGGLPAVLWKDEIGKCIAARRLDGPLQVFWVGSELGQWLAHLRMKREDLL
jgi:hypothetical protein